MFVSGGDVHQEAQRAVERLEGVAANSGKEKPATKKVLEALSRVAQEAIKKAESEAQRVSNSRKMGVVF